MTAPRGAGPARLRHDSLTKLADALLIPPFPGTEAPPWVRAALARGLAGVTLFSPNISGPGQLAELIAKLRMAAAAGGSAGSSPPASTAEPIIAIDEEGGDVTRIAHLTGSPYPGNAALGVVDDPALTRSVYHALGLDLAGLGVNLNLAPSADVNTQAGNPVIGTRSFGADPDLVARHVAEAVAGLQAAGVAACAKHFPGHGSTSVDSHHAIAEVSGSLEVITRRDLPPFTAAIKAGVRAIMPGHLRIRGLTGGLPASLSAAALTGLLRGDLGFRGVIVCDALEMRAVSEAFGLAEAAVRAVAAGTDLLCFGRDTGRAGYHQVRAALVTAVRDGRLPAARLEEAAARVAELIAWIGAQRAATEYRDAAGDGQDPGAAQRARIGLAAAQRALRLTGTPPPMAGAVLVELVPSANIAVGVVPWGLSAFVPPERAHQISVTADPPAAVPLIAPDSAAAQVDMVLGAAAGSPLLIVVRDAHRHPAAQHAIGRLRAARPDAVVVEMGLPAWQPATPDHSPAGAYLATFGATRASGRAAAELLGLIEEVSAGGADRP